MRSGLFDSIAGSVPIGALLACSSTRAIAPFYHTVGEGRTLPHVRHLYPVVSPERFERELDWLCARFEPVSLAEHARRIGSARARPSFHLSFDDGLRGVLEFAAPALRARGIPASVHVNPAFVGNASLFYRYVASLIVDRISDLDTDDRWLGEARTSLFGSDSPTPRIDREALIERVLRCRYADRHRLEAVATAIGLDIDGFLRERRPYLCTDELRELADQGFTIGAHSLDHPRYSEIDLMEQRRQTLESLAWVAVEFGGHPPAFAFPFSDVGVTRGLLDEVPAEVLLLGGQGLQREPHDRVLHRIAMEGETDDAPGERVKRALARGAVRRACGRDQVHRAGSQPPREPRRP